MAACRLVYDSRHLQADCQEPGSARLSSMGYLHLFTYLDIFLVYFLETHSTFAFYHQKRKGGKGKG